MAKYEDLTGRSFGRWTALERAGTKNGKVYWTCRCSCGTIREVESGSLQRGKTQSCGCLAAEKKRKAAHSKDELVGHQFGNWTVLRRIIQNSVERTWECRCVCGNTAIRTTSELMRGVPVSCGCIKKPRKKHDRCEIRPGMRFGMWTVVEADVTHKGEKKWICKCDCGTIRSVRARSLADGISKHCGCQRIKDISGQRFGRLIALERNGTNQHGQSVWRCKCDCGTEVDVVGYYLANGSASSCGCYRSECLTNANTTHGECKTALYAIWQGMRARCERTTSDKYAYYGGRGIAVCDEWKSYENFASWAKEHGYAEGLTLDRIDVNGMYCPENCRWVTWKEQQNNKRNTKRYEYNGESHTLSEWADVVGLPIQTLRDRVYRGWSIDRMLTQPKREI